MLLTNMTVETITFPKPVDKKDLTRQILKHHRNRRLYRPGTEGVNVTPPGASSKYELSVELRGENAVGTVKVTPPRRGEGGVSTFIPGDTSYTTHYQPYSVPINGDSPQFLIVNDAGGDNSKSRFKIRGIIFYTQGNKS